MANTPRVYRSYAFYVDLALIIAILIITRVLLGCYCQSVMHVTSECHSCFRGAYTFNMIMICCTDKTKAIILWSLLTLLH